MNPVLLKGLIGVGVIGGGGLAIGGYHLFKSAEPKTLLEKFQGENEQILDYWTASDANTGAGNYAEWTSKSNKYSQENDSNKKFDGLTIGNSSDFQKLRDECKKYLTKPIAETKSLEDKVKMWCTKDKA